MHTAEIWNVRTSEAGKRLKIVPDEKKWGKERSFSISHRKAVRRSIGKDMLALQERDKGNQRSPISVSHPCKQGLSRLLQCFLPAVQSELNMPVGRILQDCWTTTDQCQETKMEWSAPRQRSTNIQAYWRCGAPQATRLLAPAAPGHCLVGRLEELHDAF